MSEQEGKTNSQEKGQSSFRERLAVKAKELPEQVKAAIARAKTASPRNALLNLAGLTPEAKQRRLSAKEDQEKQEQQQREAKALVAEIDRIFPDNSKDYSTGYGVYKSQKEWERMGGNRERADSVSTYHTPGGERVALSEDRPSYPHASDGKRNLQLERFYVGEDGIKARDRVDLTVLQNGKVELKAGRRQRETGTETYYMGATKAQREFGWGGKAASRKAFEGEPFNDPASVLGLGKEIVGDVSKGQAERSAQPQLTSVK